MENINYNELIKKIDNKSNDLLKLDFDDIVDSIDKNFERQASLRTILCPPKRTKRIEIVKLSEFAKEKLIKANLGIKFDSNTLDIINEKIKGLFNGVNMERDEGLEKLKSIFDNQSVLQNIREILDIKDENKLDFVIIALYTLKRLEDIENSVENFEQLIEDIDKSDRSYLYHKLFETFSSFFAQFIDNYQKKNFS